MIYSTYDCFTHAVQRHQNDTAVIITSREDEETKKNIKNSTLVIIYLNDGDWAMRCSSTANALYVLRTTWAGVEIKLTLGLLRVK